MAAVKKCILCLLLALALSVNVFAMEIPTDTVVQNLNGSQQLIKTYTLPPEADPQQLIEDPFELNGFRYTFADIVKAENRVEDHKYHMEQVTVETETNSLPEIQGRRIDACIILGRSVKEVARAEGVHEESVRQSIQRGLERMKKTF